MRIPENGIILRDGDGWIVKVKGKPYVASIAGVTCENPDAAPEQQIHVKRFAKKRIYTGRQYAQAVKEVLTGKEVVVIGMNGYSALSEAQCRAWGVKPGAYEAACVGILKSVYQTLVTMYPTIDIRFAHGASNVGVDAALIKVATELNRPQLGHSCPKFMFYVEDDDLPVFVAKTQAEYAERFIDSLQILIAANGRVQAFEHDIMAVFKKLKHVVPVNVLRSISTTGGPPAINADGKIEDAVAAFEQRVHLAHRMLYSTDDMYRDMVGHLCQTTAAIVRPLLSPEQAFANSMPQFMGKIVS